MYNFVRIAANPFIGTTVGVSVCLLIVAFLMAAATGKAKRRVRSRRSIATPGEYARHHSLPGPQVWCRCYGGPLWHPKDRLWIACGVQVRQKSSRPQIFYQQFS